MFQRDQARPVAVGVRCSLGDVRCRGQRDLAGGPLLEYSVASEAREEIFTFVRSFRSDRDHGCNSSTVDCICMRCRLARVVASGRSNRIPDRCGVMERWGDVALLLHSYLSAHCQANFTARLHLVRARPFEVKRTNGAAQRAGANEFLSVFFPLSTHPRSKFASLLG